MQPMKAISAVNARPMFRNANKVAAIAASITTAMRPNGLSPLTHFTVGESSPPSAGEITSSM